MTKIPSLVSILTMVSIGVLTNMLPSIAAAAAASASASASGEGAAALASASSVSAAVRDAILSMPGGRRRLADANANCAREAEALDECASQTLSDAVGAWADCVVAAYLASQDAAAAAATATSSDDATCDALRAYMCSPVDSCPALASCLDEYTPYADCLMTQEQTSLARLCDVSCGSYSSSAGNSSIDRGNSGSNGSRTGPSESAASAHVTGAGMIRAFLAVAGLAAVHAFS